MDRKDGSRETSYEATVVIPAREGGGNGVEEDSG